MKVEDVMTKNAITVAPGSPLKEVAQTLARHRISGLPVVDDGRVLGVLSEADILEKEAVEQEPGGLRRVLGRTSGKRLGCLSSVGSTGSRL